MSRPAAVPPKQPWLNQLSLVSDVQASQIVFSANAKIVYEVIGRSESGKTLHLRRIWDYAVEHAVPDYPRGFHFTEHKVNIANVRVLKDAPPAFNRAIADLEAEAQETRSIERSLQL